MRNIEKILSRGRYYDYIFCKHCGNYKHSLNTYWMRHDPCPECGSKDSIIATGRELEVMLDDKHEITVLQFHYSIDNKMQAAVNIRKNCNTPFLTQENEGIYRTVTCEDCNSIQTNKPAADIELISNVKVEKNNEIKISNWRKILNLFLQ